MGDYAFGTTFRGWAPDEVRRVLDQVAGLWAAEAQRADALAAELKALTERRFEPDEAELTARLGDHAARLIATAREAAADILAQAEAGSGEVARVAEHRAAELAEQTEGLMARRIQEADRAAEVVRTAAASEAAERLEHSRSEAAATILAAQAEGREMVAQARSVRGRMLDDLSRRRRLAERQLDQLMAGRSRLVKSYDVVRRTLNEVADELAAAEDEVRLAADQVGGSPEEIPRRPQLDHSGSWGRAPDQRPPAVTVVRSSAPKSGDLVGAGAGGEAGSSSPPGSGSPSRSVAGGFKSAAAPSRYEPGPMRAEHKPSIRPQAVAEAVSVGSPVQRRQSVDTNVLVPAVSARTEGKVKVRPSFKRLASVADAAPTAPDLCPTVAADRPAGSSQAFTVVGRMAHPIDDLFARIRADQSQAPGSAKRPSSGSGDKPASSRPSPKPGHPSPAAGHPAANTARSGEAPAELDDEVMLARRDAALDPLETQLCRSLKRTLQDEQSAVLDRLRRSRSAADSVLPARQDQIDRFTIAALEPLTRAADAGVAFAGGHAIVGLGPHDRGEGIDVDALVMAEDLTLALVEPLRIRLESLLGAGDGSDGPVARLDATERVSAVYRQWKLQKIQLAARNHLSLAFNRGAFQAMHPGVMLRWVVDDDDRDCPDCDDNALAGALRRGEPFPTGQLYPPAHAGCRCLLVAALT